MSLPSSDDAVLLLHNPRCSKSRAARALLEELGIEFDERRYLEDPLSREELDDLHRRLGRPPREWIRRGRAELESAGVDPSAGDEVLLDAIARQPALLERPIVVRGARALVGRPPSDVRELFA